MDPREHADLERRVQAHEELLIALITAVAKDHPPVLTELEALISVGGASDATQPSTQDHVAQILRIVRRRVGAN